MSKIIYKKQKPSGLRQTTKEFIAKARRVHGNRYDYSKVYYKNSSTKVTIICPIHGEFQQPPGFHIFGHGCPACADNIASSTEEFTKKAMVVHGNRYDYSKVDYKNAHSKITIICPKHGEFQQKPNSHLCGCGCLLCGRSRSSTKRIRKDFIIKAIRVHGNKYDYSKVVYKHGRSNVTIICRVHGEFQQKPNNHIAGNGCPKCGVENLTGFDRSSDPHPGFLYFLTCKLGNDYFCKIGTAYDTKKRFRAFPFEIIDSLIIPGIIGPLSIIEEKIKKDFKEYRYIPKVKFGGGMKECFLIHTQRLIEMSVKKHLK